MISPNIIQNAHTINNIGDFVRNPSTSASAIPSSSTSTDPSRSASTDATGDKGKRGTKNSATDDIRSTREKRRVEEKATHPILNAEGTGEVRQVTFLQTRVCWYNTVRPKLQKQNDIPNAVYDLITLEEPLPSFDWELWKEYMTSVLSADAWRTADYSQPIFNSPNQPEGVEDYISHMVTRILLVYSECIHNEEKPCDLTESETTYCFYTIWPFLRLASAAVSGLKCDFSVGETGLRAMSNVRYNADRKIYIASSKLDILLSETSGAYGTNDLGRHTLDHIKGAFGSHGMLLKILATNHGGDSNPMDDICVFFVHASAKDQYIRLWSMRSVNEGEFISFERVKAVFTIIRRWNRS